MKGLVDRQNPRVDRLDALTPTREDRKDTELEELRRPLANVKRRSSFLRNPLSGGSDGVVRLTALELQELAEAKASLVCKVKVAYCVVRRCGGYDRSCKRREADSK